MKSLTQMKTVRLHVEASQKIHILLHMRARGDWPVSWP